jgi:hypothetical protein
MNRSPSVIRPADRGTALNVLGTKVTVLAAGREAGDRPCRGPAGQSKRRRDITRPGGSTAMTPVPSLGLLMKTET